MIPPTALLGLHQREARFLLTMFLQTQGYDVANVTTLEEMSSACQVILYDIYIMDINLGSPHENTIVPAQEIYAFLQQQPIKNLKERFYNISEREELVKKAVAAGLPAVLNTRFPALLLEQKLESSP